MAYQSPLRLIFNICTGRAGSDDMCPTEGSTGKMVTRLSSLASREAKSCRIKFHRFQPVSRFVRPGFGGMKELEKEIRCSRRPGLNGEFGHDERDTELRGTVTQINYCPRQAMARWWVEEANLRQWRQLQRS